MSITIHYSLKKLVLRENEERSVSRERPKISGEKATQSGDERRLIRLQSTMPKQEAPTKPFEWGADEVAPDNSRQHSHREYHGTFAKNERKEEVQYRQDASSSSKTRSVSVFDARPPTQGNKVERKENQLTPEQKKQIDLGIITFEAVKS